MLSRIFSNGSARPGSSSSRPPSRKKARSSGSEEKTPVNALAAQSAMNDAHRELFKYEMPNNERGFTDLLSTYKEGERFQYVALTGADEETFEARIRRLVTLQPRVNKSMIPDSRIPRIRLVEDTEQFPLSMAIPRRGKDYVRVASITIIYVPLTSALSDFSKVRATLIDTRLIGNQKVQSIQFNSNIAQKNEMSMDCCIPRESADKIVLNISREQAVLMLGEQWGAVQLMLKIEESDFPYMSNFKEVSAVAAMPPAVLDEHQVDPNHLDITILENHRQKLRDMYLAGDIADETEPQVNKKSIVKYSKSTLNLKKKPKGTKMEGAESPAAGWEFMRGAVKPLMDADQASVDPSQDGFSNTSIQREDDDSSVKDHPLYQKMVEINGVEAIEREKRKHQAFVKDTDSDEEVVPLQPAVKKGVRFNATDL